MPNIAIPSNYLPIQPTASQVKFSFDPVKNEVSLSNKTTAFIVIMGESGCPHLFKVETEQLLVQPLFNAGSSVRQSVKFIFNEIVVDHFDTSSHAEAQSAKKQFENAQENYSIGYFRIQTNFQTKETTFSKDKESKQTYEIRAKAETAHNEKLETKNTVKSDDIPVKTGTRTYHNGDKYIGDLKDGKRDGKGTMKYANGDEYTGEWRDDKCSGKGTMKYADGDEYTGGWKNGEHHGKGIYEFADGSKYDGNYKNDKRHGKGIYEFADGSKYDGNYKNGKRHGKGTRTYSDGSGYVGEFRNGEETATYQSVTSSAREPETVEAQQANEPSWVNIQSNPNRDQIARDHGYNDLFQMAHTQNDRERAKRNAGKSEGLVNHIKEQNLDEAQASTLLNKLKAVNESKANFESDKIIINLEDQADVVDVVTQEVCENEVCAIRTGKNAAGKDIYKIMNKESLIQLLENGNKNNPFTQLPITRDDILAGQNLLNLVNENAK